MTNAPHHLLGLGQLPWDEVRRLVTGLRCAWADYDGFHLDTSDQLPVEAPAYSHLWAWSAQDALRARLDGDHAHVGVLTTDASRWPAPLLDEEVTVTARDAWPHRDGADHVTLLETRGPMPITFVRVD